MTLNIDTGMPDPDSWPKQPTKSLALELTMHHAMTDPCENGCNGCDECTDYDDDSAEQFGVCPRCHDDGRDPWNDYLLPCPLCQGEQTP